LIGALAFASNGEPRWSADLVANAELVGEVLASVLRRQRSEDALRQSEIMKSAILESLASGVAVIDRDGALLQVNDRWAELTKESEWLNAPIGSNVVTRCWAAFERGDAVAGDIIAGLTAVLERARSRFIVEHRIEVGGAPAWLSLTAVPLNRPEGGAVLTRADVTELRRAEMNAQRSRDELAHVSRVFTIGELTASLAHELNQPLAAIMTNAQAGGRILDSARPDFAEVRAILRDIVADDRRASDVIGRLRVLLRKGEFDMTRVDITATIRSVVDLLTSEAVIRNVMISLGLADDPAYVRGDRVQLQQVILNLVHNGMEAMSAPQHDGARRIVIGCRRESDRHVTIDVHDTGPGLHPGTEEAIFEPFFTTKPSGMGMGLSIVRSIVEAHHGTVHASNDPAGGARFQVVLPADRDLPP
jgi:C4-dicarboxylate-specific signal transduction histidine kinase